MKLIVIFRFVFQFHHGKTLFTNDSKPHFYFVYCSVNSVTNHANHPIFPLSGNTPVSYLGCYRESKNHPLFNRVYFDPRRTSYPSRRPSLSSMIQICAREAVKKKYSYFAIKRWRQCTWGRKGLSITRRRKCRNRCHNGVGRLRYAAVYRIQRASGYCFH